MWLEEGTVVRWKGSGEKGTEGGRQGNGTGNWGEGMEGRVVEGRNDGGKL